MNTVKYISLVAALCLCAACGSAPHREPGAAELLNRESFELRYRDIAMSRAKAFEALREIAGREPENYPAMAEAWNNIAYSHFLTSHFDSTRLYLNKIRDIDADYANKEIEEAITYVTEARLYLRECKYADAFIIYDSVLTIFNGGLVNKLKYNDILPLKKYDRSRYYWAKSDYLVGNAVLGYYYRDTELPVILRALDQIAADPRLQVDTTQLSVLYYTYAGSYEKAIAADPQNYYKTIENVKAGLDILENPTTRNDYHLANFYQITASMLLNDGTREWLAGADSTRMRECFDGFADEYLVGKYGWQTAEVRSDSLPLLLLKKSDAIFERYDDPYQLLASAMHIGNYYLARGDAETAWRYYMRGVGSDAVIKARKGYARVWTRRLYATLLRNTPEGTPTGQVREWWDIFARESAVIVENTRRDYDAQRGRLEAEAVAKRSQFFGLFILMVCIAVTVLLYFLARQNRKLRAARSVLGQRNEELEENREDLESLAMIGKHVMSTLEIDNDAQKAEFIDGIYSQIKGLGVLSALPDFSFILYIKGAGDELQRYCKEDADSRVDVSIHPLTDLARPAVGCFLRCDREVLVFGDWNEEYSDYARRMGVDPTDIDPHRTIAGNPTRSLAFVNLFGKHGEKTGVLSWQTTEPYAFKNSSLLLASFEIIAEYVAAALDNAVQYQRLRFMQNKLIEQKRMELLTHVVRGISHELSQPLGSITQTLYDTVRDVEALAGPRDGMTDEEYYATVGNLRSDMQTIAQSKDTISDLVRSFRNTIKENIIDPETEFNLAHRLDDIVRVTKPTIKSNINLEVECDPAIVVRSFPLLFSQVMTNLISNANQHAFPGSDDPGDTIRIVCRASGRDLVVTCADNGIGIPEDELDMLCQPFVSKNQANLGLGLALVKNIVEQYMRGEIRFSSGKGLTVTIVIPDCIVKK